MGVNYKKIIDYNLRKMGISNPKRVYGFLDRLGRITDIESPKLDFTEVGGIGIVAECTGKLKIGNSLKGLRSIDPEIKQNVDELFETISRKTGFRVKGYPGLREPLCSSSVKIDGTPITITLRKRD